MVGQICSVGPGDVAAVGSSGLFAWVGSLGIVLGELGTPVVHSGSLRHGFGERAPGQPRVSWRTLAEGGHHGWVLGGVDPCGKGMWGSEVRYGCS